MQVLLLYHIVHSGTRADSSTIYNLARSSHWGICCNCRQLFAQAEGIEEIND